MIRAAAAMGRMGCPSPDPQWKSNHILDLFGIIPPKRDITDIG